MPSVITFSGNRSITYGYDAAGNKLSVAYLSDGEPTKMEYAGNRVYNNNMVTTLLTDEGYIDTGTTPVYHYYLKDHQGNNRVVVNQAGTVEEVNHYYPFGGVFSELARPSIQRYKYSGKELDRKFDLDMLDYGARHYDPALGRWFTVDPMAEKYYSISPYVYVANNPVKYIDPTGEDIWEIDHDGKVIFVRKNKKHILYALDENGNRTGESLTLKSGEIFEELKMSGENSNYDASFFIGNEDSQNDILKTFKFVADNTNVEWRVDKFKNSSGDIGYSIGTVHENAIAIPSERMGHTTSSVSAFIHSHPDVGISGELVSMGLRPDGTSQKNSDMYLKTNNFHYKNGLYYTYFPNTGNVWSVRGNNQKPAFIRKVNSYKGLFWGTLNTR